MENAAGRRGLWVAAYDYLLKELAEDFWSLLKKEWVEKG